MKNNKLAYAVWLFFNFFAYALLVIVLRAIHATGYKTAITDLPGNLYLYFISFAIYIYVVALFWNALREHINLADEIRGIQSNEGLFTSLMNSLSDWVLNESLLACVVLPLWYWMARVCVIVFDWLKTGEFVTYTTCDAIHFCNIESSFIGLNLILNWIGNAEFGLFVSALGGLLFSLFKMHPKFK